MRSSIVLVCAALLLPASGCATALNLSSNREVFGGTKIDVTVGPMLIWNVIRPQPEPCMFGWWGGLYLGTAAIVDLPFSFLADIATLPVTIPAEYGSWLAITEPAEASPASLDYSWRQFWMALPQQTERPRVGLPEPVGE